MKPLSAWLTLAAGLALAGPGLAQNWEVSGAITGELRYFTESPAFPGQTTDRLQGSLSFEARGVYSWNGGNDQIVVAPFLRWGEASGGRNHFDLREAYWLRQGDGWSLTAGVDKVFWGVTESRNPVDIVNQDDLREDIGGSAKLGQPMVNLNLYGEWGTLELYVLPWFRPRDFPDFGARLAGPAPIGAPVYTDPDGRRNVDYALRWSRSIGEWDLGLSYFRGTSREPVLVPAGPTFVPRYDQISQAGLDVQFTAGDWLWKLEAIDRTGQGPRFQAVTAGFEWSLYGIGGSGADLGLIAEWNYDNRDKAQAPATLYDNDLFLGARLSLNDIGSTSLLAGTLIDRRTDARVFMIEGQRRLGEDWLLEVTGRFMEGGTFPDPIAAVQSDDYLSVSMRYSF